MEQIRFTEVGPVLDRKGHPRPGWASSGILEYNKKAIKAPWYRIKEWDWYQVNNDHMAFQMTYGHASYAGQVGIMLFDFVKGKTYCVRDEILFLPLDKIYPQKSAEEDHTIVFKKADFDFGIRKSGDTTVLDVITYDKKSNDILDAKFKLTRTTPNSLVVNIPFNEYKTAFYYNQKISCMKAEGRMRVGNKVFEFEDDDSWGLLDWGRGVWPFHNEWYWSSASGRLNGEIFGFNLGAGFGNTEYATENCIFYKGELHKLGQVKFDRSQSYYDPWHIYDDEGRCDLTMTPTFDRETATKLLWVNNNTHQMFGHFRGKVTLDNGSQLQVDGIIGFAEHAVNNW